MREETSCASTSSSPKMRLISPPRIPKISSGLPPLLVDPAYQEHRWALIEAATDEGAEGIKGELLRISRAWNTSVTVFWSL
jgi:hypothetical protein